MRELAARAAAATELDPAAASGGHALDITQCGQRVPDGVAAVLQADLTCPPAGFCVGNTGGPIDQHACVLDFDCPNPSQMQCRQFH